MAEDKIFEDKAQLEDWLKGRGVDERRVVASGLLWENEFNRPSTLLGISSDDLKEVGFSIPVARHLSNKLKLDQRKELRLFDLVFRNIPTGSSGTPHILQDLTDFPMDNLKSLVMRESSNPLFQRYHLEETDDGKIFYSREIQVQVYCEQVVKDVIRSCNYNLRTDTEAALNGLKVDIGIIRNQNDDICGTMEVKQPKRKNMLPPDPDPMNHPKVVTQVMSQMIPLRTLYGVQNAYGILTTYSSWRFFKWEMMTDDEALATRHLVDRLHVSEPREEERPGPSEGHSFRTPQKAPIELQTTNNRASPPMSPKPYTEPDNADDEEEELEADHNHESPLRGVLYASDVIPAGSQVLKMLAWVLGEMQQSPVRKIPAHKRDFLYVVEKDASSGYERLSHNLEHYKGRMPNSTNKKLYVLEELGHRFHGRVFRMMSRNGNLCVLKYFVKPQHVLNKNGKRVEVSAEAAAKKSTEYWNKAYNKFLPRASTGKWGGGDAVIMPDLEKISLEVDRNIVIQRLKETMEERFFQLGLWHGDPAWRNVAVVRDKKGDISKVCMIDLEPEKMIEAVESSRWDDFDSMWAEFRKRLEDDWATYEAAEIASDNATV